MTIQVHEGKVEKPIILQPWKVKKILEWDWEQEGPMETRRIITPPRDWDSRFYQHHAHLWEHVKDSLWQPYSKFEYMDTPQKACGVVACPYGQPGTLLWVKETFVKFDPPHWPPYGYKADWISSNFEDIEKARKELGYKYSSSRFMPKKATRLWLEVVEIRVERLQQVGGTSAWKEGEFTVQQFKEVWNEINEKRGYGWKENPFVWVVAYRRYQP